jgi:hypothetical protein
VPRSMSTRCCSSLRASVTTRAEITALRYSSKLGDLIDRRTGFPKRNGLSLGRSFPRRARLAAGLLGVSMVASGWSGPPAKAAEEGSSTYGVSIEVTFENLDVVANSSAPIGVEIGQAATVTVSVLDIGPAGSPAVIDDPSALLEIEHPSGSRTRFADWDQISDSAYQADFTFSEPGTWRVVTLPDLEDRSLLPPGSTDAVAIIVNAPLVQEAQAGDFSLLVLGGLLLVVVALVLYLTRHKLPWDHQPKTPSVAHDTWWNSP